MDQADKLRKLMESKNVYTPNHPFRVIAVSSGKGGVGKTNFVSNLALAMQKRGLRTAIIDGDLGMADVDILFGIKTNHSIYDILYSNKRIEDVIVTTNQGIKIIPGGSGIVELSEISQDKRLRLLSEFSRIKNIDVLLIDTGAGISKITMNLISVADDVIVITNPEPTALTDAYGLIKIIVKGQMNKNLNLVINRVVNIKEARETFEKLSKTVDIFLDKKINYMGFISEDSKVGQAVREQRPFFELFPRCEASLCIQRISSEILGYSEKTKNTSINDYFKKLFGLMGR